MHDLFSFARVMSRESPWQVIDEFGCGRVGGGGSGNVLERVVVAARFEAGGSLS